MPGSWRKEKGTRLPTRVHKCFRDRDLISSRRHVLFPQKYLHSRNECRMMASYCKYGHIPKHYNALSQCDIILGISGTDACLVYKNLQYCLLWRCCINQIFETPHDDVLCQDSVRLITYFFPLFVSILPNRQRGTLS